MIEIQKYIFYIVYRFYQRVFHESEIPHYFAITIVIILLVGAYNNVFSILYLITLKSVFYEMTTYSKYIALVSTILGVYFVNKSDRYKKELKYVSQIKKEKKRRLAFFSILYVSLMITLLIYTALKLRSLHDKGYF